MHALLSHAVVSYFMAWCYLRSIPFYDCLSSQICAAETVINKGNLMWRVVYCIASPTQRMLFLSSVFIYKHGLMHLNHEKEIEVSKIWKKWTSTDLALAVTKERRSFEITPPPPNERHLIRQWDRGFWIHAPPLIKYHFELC